MVTKKKTAKKTTVKKVIEKKVSPKIVILSSPKVTPKKYEFLGIEDLKGFLPANVDEIAGYVKKFSMRFGVKLKFEMKFRAFKLLRSGTHVDWITLNDLMKRYDSRIPPVKMLLHPQRPYERKRIYK